MKADREIRLCAGDIDRQGPCGMGEIPDRQRPDRVGLPRQRRHVVQSPCPVVDLCQHQYGEVLGDVRLDLFRRDDAQFVILPK